MALIKNQTLDNGVAVDYHRVVSLTGVVGVQTSVEVASYCSEQGRAAEARLLEEPGAEGTYPYIYTRYFVMPFEDGMTVADAYAYLLTLPEFEGAESDEGGEGD